MPLQLAPAIGHPPKCTVAVVLRKVSPEDRDVISGWLDDPEIGHSRIAASIPDEYGKIAAGTISRHRRGLCSCGDY